MSHQEGKTFTLQNEKYCVINFSLTFRKIVNFAADVCNIDTMNYNICSIDI